jgi:hypothetical protein
MGKIRIWLKIGSLFIDQDLVRSFKRFGSQTQISLYNEEVYTVNISYDKVIELLPSIKN